MTTQTTTPDLPHGSRVVLLGVTNGKRYVGAVVTIETPPVILRPRAVVEFPDDPPELRHGVQCLRQIWVPTAGRFQNHPDAKRRLTVTFPRTPTKAAAKRLFDRLRREYDATAKRLTAEASKPVRGVEDDPRAAELWDVFAECYPKTQAALARAIVAEDNPSLAGMVEERHTKACAVFLREHAQRPRQPKGKLRLAVALNWNVGKFDKKHTAEIMADLGLAGVKVGTMQKTISRLRHLRRTTPPGPPPRYTPDI